MQNRTPAARTEPLPDFQPVARQYRHDGWTPERQRAFIAALADTGSVSRAAAMVNMSPEGAYYLRRQAGAESFRRAWEAALDFGVQRLKDLAFERAIEGELVPVMSFGKLVGYRRKTNDRLLMFCLRMNAKAPDGRRYAQTYFDPAAPRLTGTAPQALPQVSEPLAPTEAELVPVGLDGQATQTSDDQAALIRQFDPVHLSLEQIEALQQLLSDAAATRRALDQHPEFDPAIPYVPEGQVHHALELGGAEDPTGTYHRGGETEIDWRNLDEAGLAHQAEVDAVIAAMRQSTEGKSNGGEADASARPRVAEGRPGCGASRQLRRHGIHSHDGPGEEPKPKPRNPTRQRKAR
ncbi:hypothetical protein V6R86_04170 [Sphingomonas kaistensis]|uniref:Uncharacterized protein n=1 Tax=Sphingomonas kaistensis TaxID=298708 RepID=A0ABZ2G2C6_9SPHN